MHTLFIVFIIISSSYTCTYTPCRCKHVCYTEFEYIYSSKKASFNFWQFLPLHFSTSNNFFPFTKLKSSACGLPYWVKHAQTHQTHSYFIAKILFFLHIFFCLCIHLLWLLVLAASFYFVLFVFISGCECMCAQNWYSNVKACNNQKWFDVLFVSLSFLLLIQECWSEWCDEFFGCMWAIIEFWPMSMNCAMHTKFV